MPNKKYICWGFPLMQLYWYTEYIHSKNPQASQLLCASD